MKVKRPVSRLLAICLFFLFTVNCSMVGQVANSLNTQTTTQTATIEPSFTKAPPLAKTATKTPTLKATIKPFELIGIWKTDDMRAPDNSWKIAYSIYLKFTDTKQSVYHGVDTFNNNRTTDEGDLVSISGSTFIKKIVYIPEYPGYLGKFQKWTWRFSNGKVFFEIYRTLDSQEQALNDTVLTALATGVKVEQ
jgi:hypothetical protein